MTQELLPFLLLIKAGIFVIIFHLLQHQKQLNRLAARTAPEVSDFTSCFTDLQERITSEAEETRKQQDSHCKNNQTAIRTLTGAVKKLPATNDVIEAAAIGHTSTVEAITKHVDGDGKLTRRRIAEVKTRLADEEKDDQRAKAVARCVANKIENGYEVKVESDASLPEGTMVLKDESTGDEVTISDVTPESLVKAAKKATKNKKKRKASK